MLLVVSFSLSCSSMASFVLFSLLLLLLLLTYNLLFSKKSKLPPSPLGLPILGNLLQLSALAHRSLAALSQPLGPLILIRLGQVPVLVASSPSAARDILKTHDQAFSNRPTYRAINLLSGGRNLSFSPDGDYWRRAKKLCVTHLLSPNRVRSLRAVRAEEATAMCGRIAAAQPVATLHITASPLACPAPPVAAEVDMSEILYAYSNGVVSRAAAGRGSGDGSRARKFKEMLEDSSLLFRGLQVEDVFPSMGWVGRITGLDAKLARMGRRWHEFLGEVVEEHERRAAAEGASAAAAAGEDEDFVDVLLRLRREEGGDFGLTDKDIKAIIMDMIAAGTDTSFVTLEWTMSELIRHPRVLHKLQAEVRNIAAPKPTIDEQDLESMPYLRAVLKEVLRLRPPAPLLVMRESTEATTLLQGYEIPAKTRVMINAWAIGRDGGSWESPEEFRPERFVGSDVDFRGHDFQLIPFGAGRRMCPGMHFAVATVEMAVASLVYQFDWGLPEGMRVEDLDMSEAPGLTTPRKVALRLVATPHSM